MRMIRTLTPDLVAAIPRDDELRAAMFRADALERITTSSRAPADWHEFMRTVVDVDRDLHSGTAGVMDSAFFRDVRNFLNRAGAPAEARAGIDFLEGISAWNWPLAATAAKTLIASQDTVEWVPDVLLRNGAAVANIILRDTTEAKRVLQTFAKRTYDDPFRERLIASYLVYSDSTLRRRRGWQ